MIAVDLGQLRTVPNIIDMGIGYSTKKYQQGQSGTIYDLIWEKDLEIKPCILCCSPKHHTYIHSQYQRESHPVEVLNDRMGNNNAVKITNVTSVE